MVEKRGGRRLLSCKRTIRSEENLGWYLKDSNENVFQGVKYVRILKFRESVSKKEVAECEKRNKCIDSLLESCLNAETKKFMGLVDKN